MCENEASGQQAVEPVLSAAETADRLEAWAREMLASTPPKTGALHLLDAVHYLRTAAPTAPSTAAGEMAFVCGCGWDGSYADMNETVEGMTCPKCRLGRNLDCAAALATPPAQGVEEETETLETLIDAAIGARTTPPWQEQAAQHLIQRADRINQESGFYTLVGEALYQAADELRALARSEKGEGK